MANPYDNDKRLLELLERWQSGDFTRADEQELQALTDSDAFRRETAEGYMAVPEADHAKHLASLQQRLQARSGTARKLYFPQMLAAAAAIGVIILGVIWLMPSTLSEKAGVSGEISQSPEPTRTLTDTISSIGSDSPDLAEVPSRSAAVERSRDMAENTPFNTDLPDLAAAPSRSTAPERLKDMSEINLSQTALPGSSYPTMARPDSVNQLLSYGSSAPAAPGAGEVAASERVATVQTDDEAKAEEVLDEVDMSQYNTLPTKKAKTKAKPKAATPAGKEAPKKASNAASAQPSGGWDAFNDYLRRNARLPEQARQNNVSGIVRIRFTLDQNNKPGSFIVLKSLGFGCDEAARQLIEAYTWQPGSNNEVTVDVPFVR
ncbi:MAG TPA: energy transducer TonB [Saprospiraceae bacterium]|nr:energy transducer TonB [Saprospiraceae bacterium]